MTGLLGIEPGSPGSGRARYGRAMTLYAEGRISTAQLEAYRVAAADDRAGPGAVLEAHGLAVPGDGPEAAVRGLIDGIARYLADLAGPGIGEVRDGLARWRDGPVTGFDGQAANRVVTTHLPDALSALAQTHTGFAAAIARAHPHLHWKTYDGYDPALIGDGFANGHTYASLIGEDASVIPAQDFDLGLFLIAPHVLYRDHCHAAPELYAPLTGPHGWRFGPDTPLTVLPAHAPVWNPPHRAHLTKVGPVPFLCLYVWTRDVQPLARVIPARDWPELEALRLG
jgi:Dimethlysulfonioproprionate lyase